MTDSEVPADLARLMQLVVTRHAWGKGLTAEQMQEKLASVLDDGRTHLVSVRTLVNLELFKIGRAYFTTRRHVEAMMEKCRIQVRGAPSRACADNLTEEARRRASHTAALALAEHLKMSRRKT